jgi:hypothetical protein
VSLDDRIRAAFDRALAEVHELTRTEVDEVRRAAEVSSAALRESSNRLSDCIQAIDDAPSLGAVLTVVAGGARLETGRAGMILVHDGNVAAYPSRAEVPPAQAQLARSVVETGSAAAEGDSAAFPITVGGLVVAVLMTAAPALPESTSALEVLVRYAGRVLETRTIAQITGLTPLTRPSGASMSSAS